MTDSIADSALELLEAAEIAQVRKHIIYTYILRGINLAVEHGVLDRVVRSNVSITQRGEMNCGYLDATEDEMREAFDTLQLHGHVHESIEYDDAFTGVVSKGEVIH